MPQQVQQFAEALASLPCQPLQDKFEINFRGVPEHDSPTFAQAFACPALQSATWPQHVRRVEVKWANLEATGSASLQSVFSAAEIVHVR